MDEPSVISCCPASQQLSSNIVTASKMCCYNFTWGWGIALPRLSYRQLLSSRVCLVITLQQYAADAGPLQVLTSEEEEFLSISNGSKSDEFDSDSEGWSDTSSSQQEEEQEDQQVSE